MSEKNGSYVRTLGDLLPGVILPPHLATVAAARISADSRSVEPGDVFFALPGTQKNGTAFIDDAVAAGAVAVVCGDPLATGEATVSWRKDVPLIGVVDVRRALACAAANLYGKPSGALTVFGVTGTNGKSTCTFLLAQLFELLGTRSGVLGTLGYGRVTEELRDTGMTTPDAITCQQILRELLDDQVRVVAMEVSSHALAQQRTAAVKMTGAIFTNLSRDHLDYHGDMRSYAQAKARLFASEGLQHAVINIDDEAGAAEMTQALQPGTSLWTFSLINPAAQVYANRVEYHSAGIRATIRSPWGSGEVRTRLLGEFNLSNLLAVITAACAQGADFRQVLSLVPQLAPVKGRMQVLDVTGDIRVVIDYAHTPDALRQALRALRLHSRQKLHLVFGCGGDRDSGKRPQMAAVAEAGADRVVVTSDNPRTESRDKIINEICAGFSSSRGVDIVVDRAEAIARAVDTAAPGDLVLIAGKGHENYQIVGLDRLPFDDEAQARLALRRRAARSPTDTEGGA